MASKNVVSIALLLSLNLLFFTLVSSNYVPTVPCTPIPKSPKSDHDKSTPAHKKPLSCPEDTLKLRVCANLLNIVRVRVGAPPEPCCSLIAGLADLEAAICLCTAIRANVLGINLNVPLSLSAVLNNCGRKVPEGYKCA
ncbi:hypothetical protein PTKIN_Ptkin04bG0206300 [Pterospermum kingtungense]